MPLSFLLPPSLGKAKAEARAELIEGALSRELGEPVKARVAGSYGELEDLLFLGQCDMAWAPAAVCVKLPPVRAILTIVREGQDSYLSALVGRRASALSVATLQGTRAAWVDPLSGGGFLLVTNRLRAEGIEPDRVFASQRFLGSHRATVDAVLHEEADVCALSTRTSDPTKMNELLQWYAGPAGHQLVPLLFSERCLNDAVVLTSTLPEPEARRIVEKLAPPVGHSRSRILPALEAEDLTRASLTDYKRLGPLLGLDRRRTVAPPPSR